MVFLHLLAIQTGSLQSANSTCTLYIPYSMLIAFRIIKWGFSRQSHYRRRLTLIAKDLKYIKHCSNLDLYVIHCWSPYTFTSASTVVNPVKTFVDFFFFMWDWLQLHSPGIFSYCSCTDCFWLALATQSQVSVNFSLFALGLHGWKSHHRFDLPFNLSS